MPADGLFGLSLSATLVLLYGSSNVLALVIISFKSAWEEIRARQKRRAELDHMFTGSRTHQSKLNKGKPVHFVPKQKTLSELDILGSTQLVSGLTDDHIELNELDNIDIHASNNHYVNSKVPTFVNDSSQNKNNRLSSNPNYRRMQSKSPRSDTNASETIGSMISSSDRVGSTRSNKSNHDDELYHEPTHIRKAKSGLQFDLHDKDKDPILDDPDRGFLSKWFWRWWRYREVVLPFMIHVWDTATDLGVLYQWYSEANYTGNVILDVMDDRNGITTLGLALFSTSAMILYRLVSALTIWKVTNGNVKETVLQVLDLKILNDLSNLSSQVDIIDSLRWVHKMEALLESGPQALLQIVFVIKSQALLGNLDSGDYLVFASLLFSLCTLATRLINDDRYVFVQSANRMFPPSSSFLMRAFFRLFEVTSRVISVAFVWVTFGSGVVYIWWLFQAAVLFTFFRAGFLGLEVWNVFGYVLATPDLALKQLRESTATIIEKILLFIFGCVDCWWLGGFLYITNMVPERHSIAYLFITARFLESFCFLVIVYWVSTFDDRFFPCVWCTPYEIRNSIFYETGFVFWTVAAIATVAAPLLFFIMSKLKYIRGDNMLVRSGNPIELLSVKRYDQFKKFLGGDGKHLDHRGNMMISEDLDEQIVVAAAIHASQIGDKSALKILGEMSFNFDSFDRFGRTCLIYCAREDHFECIEIIAKNSANLDLLDKNGKSAVVHCCELGNSQSLKILGQLGANLNCTDENGKPASHYAFEKGHMNCITVFSEFGVEWTMPGSQISDLNDTIKDEENKKLHIDTKNLIPIGSPESLSEEHKNGSSLNSNPLSNINNNNTKISQKQKMTNDNHNKNIDSNQNKIVNNRNNYNENNNNEEENIKSNNTQSNSNSQQVKKTNSSFLFRDHNVSPLGATTNNDDTFNFGNDSPIPNDNGHPSRLTVGQSFAPGSLL